MPINNTFPVGYTPNYLSQLQTQMQQPQAQEQQPQSIQVEIVYIRGGKIAAEVYPVAPGKTVWLLDFEAPYLYVKSVDAQGVPMPLRTFKIEEVGSDQGGSATESTIASRNSNYVTKDELEKILKRYQRKSRRNPGPKEDNND